MINDEFQTSGSLPTRPPQAGQKPVLDTPVPLDTSFPTVPRPVGEASDARSGLLSDGVVIKGRYRVVRHLASGGMGDVYEVFDEVSREPRAVKVMKSQLLSSPEARERFLKESKAQDLRHPNIVKTIDVDEWPEQHVLFIAMELAPGKTLRQWQRDQKVGAAPVFTVADALEICRQVCAGLAYAHRLTIHRDIKPENILLEKTDDDCWHARIADFGITKLLEVGEFTATSQGFGTFQYMAPEQQRDAGSVDHRADIYSVGVVLYELLTGQLPVGHFPMPSETQGAIPREIDSLIKRSLAASPDSRYSDMAMMLADVERVSGMVTENATPRQREAVPVDLSNVNLGQIVVELRERRLAQVEVPGLPPIPEEILRLRAQLEDLDQAIADLKLEIHPALRPHQETLRQVETQHDAAVEELESDPLIEKEALRRRLDEVLRTKSTIDSAQLQQLADDDTDVSVLLETVIRLQHVKNAVEAMNRARKQYNETRDTELGRLAGRREGTEGALNDACTADLHELLKMIGLGESSGDSTTLPLGGWSRMSRLLAQQGRYPWDQWESMARAECIWKAQAGSTDRSAPKHKQSASHEACEEEEARHLRNFLFFIGIGIAIIISFIFMLTTSYSKNAPLRIDAQSAEIAAHKLQESAAVTFGVPMERQNSLGMSFCLIPAGEFLMGSPDQDEYRLNRERPQHKVRITRQFYLQTTEVTEYQWDSVMSNGGDIEEIVSGGAPATNVNWSDAVEFCHRLGNRENEEYRLPTEAEWEYACRAGTQSYYCFGNDKSGMDEYIGGFGYSTFLSDVGTKKCNGWGLYDMHGNVREWCSDWYAENWYAVSPVNDPKGPSSGERHVYRGGGFHDYQEAFRSASRGGHTDADLEQTGFRVVLVLK
ncbi:MAG: SUMF1/EgtB/PvdO family nonheme iron enzyme [Rhodopirellula sp.]|nr:SUMF1/EgtB/PvdO family nonheme iron enzyme [Rhodopirellula sp.]